MQHLSDGADLSGSQSASSTASGTDMDDQLLSLTDDALLAVLAFVPTRDLFSLRVLCRRLRDLCLLPELWRWRNIGSWDKPAGTGLLRAALTLAPCLRGIHVGDEDDLEAVASYVSSTSCVIAGLGLSFRSSEEAFATTILQAVHSLGGLRMLDVTIRSSSTFHEIVYLIYSLRDLRQLKIYILNCGEPSFGSRPDLEVKPSLVQLCCYDSEVCTEEGLEPFLPLFLEAHAATLEDVDLGQYVDEVSLTLLGTLPKLRSLTCFEVPVAALGFVRQLSQLRSVVFHSCMKRPNDALQALTESRSATVLEVLKFNSYGTMWDPMAVAACLPQFPVLRDLSLGGSYSDDFLRAVTPKSAPRLTTLSLKCDNECLHDWVHDIGIQDLLARNHRLHLKVDFFGGKMVVCGCRSCRWGCHKDLRRHFLFSSHRRMADCPRDCYQVVVWPCSSSG